MIIKRVTDRKLLASFIEYVADDKITPLEWKRFMITHYEDSLMEVSRSECVGIMSGYTYGDKPSKLHQDRLYELAKELRS
jgi:hypothetical protein